MNLVAIQPAPNPYVTSNAACPKPVASICKTLAESSPNAIAWRAPWDMLFDSISKWLGPGALINASTVAT